MGDRHLNLKGHAARLGTLGLLLLSILAGLTAAELILRARGVVYTLDCLNPDPALGYTLKPGLHGFVGGVEHSYNSRGLRDKEYPDRTAPGVKRLLFIGDSITFAQSAPLEATFVKRVEALLRPRRTVEALNAGVPGYNACDEAAFYHDIGASYHPDIVVWQYCLNDVDDPWRPFSDQAKGWVPLPASWKHTLSDRLVLWGFLRAQMYGFSHLLGLMPVDTSDLTYARHVLDLYSDAQAPRRDAAWECIRRARKEILAAGGSLLMVIVPLAMQASGDHGFSDAPQRDVERRCREEGIVCLDLLSEFSLKGGWDLFARPDFIHLSERGHEVTAAAIAEEVSKLLTAR
jgi:lysophospholipase L1-like esterase